MAGKFIVLAALDLTTGSTAVLRQALELAEAQQGEVHIVTVIEPEAPIGPYPISLPDPSHDKWQRRSDDTATFCREFLAARAAERGAPHAGPPFQLHTVVGHAPDEIVWMAAHLDADVIVMATHGRRGLKRILLGSVAEKVMRTAGCPVFVVREKAHAQPWRVAEIEPVCPDCAARRAETNGEKLWCARHSEHHIRAHVLGYTRSGEDSPRAFSSSTGT